MKITPLEIRQKTFEKAFRGLDKDEVQAYLTTLSQEWEKLMDENKELRIKLETTQKEVEKLREVENSLFKTLKTAEDTGANMIDQATKAAKLHMRETEMKAEAVLNDARTKARNMIEEAELRSRNTSEDLEDHLRKLAQVYRSLENARADMVSGIRNAANEALDRTKRLDTPDLKLDIDAKLLEIKKNFFEKSDYQLLEPEKNEKPHMVATWLSPEEKQEEEKHDKRPAENRPRKVEDRNEPEEEKEDVVQSGEKPNQQGKAEGSFFDDIE